MAPPDNAGTSKVEPLRTNPETAHRQAAVGRAQRNLDEMNATHLRQDVRRRVVDMFDLGVSQMFPTGSEGFSYGAEAMPEMKRIKAEMVNELMSGPAKFDATRHEATRTKVVPTAKAQQVRSRPIRRAPSDAERAGWRPPTP